MAPRTACRGIRGAISVDSSEPEPVAAATGALLAAIVAANGCALDDVAAAIFTVPDDLAGANPAHAARAHGWSDVPLLMVREHGGDTRVARCLRVLVLWNTPLRQKDVEHVYLRDAARLRPDLTPARGDAR